MNSFAKQDLNLPLKRIHREPEHLSAQPAQITLFTTFDSMDIYMQINIKEWWKLLRRPKKKL